MQTVVRGIVTVHFELEIDADIFEEICDDCSLKAENHQSFTADDWVKIRKGFLLVCIDNELHLSYNDIHDYSRMSVDEVAVELNGDVTAVQYEIENKVDSVYINDERKI
jgi:hypothetical protein